MTDGWHYDKRDNRYWTRTGDRERFDIVAYYHAFTRCTDWTVYRVTEGEKGWMRPEREEISHHPRLRDAKVAVVTIREAVS